MKDGFADSKVFGRLVDIAAGGASWVFILTLVALSYFYPVAVAVFVTFYIVYWVTQNIFVARHSVISFKRVDETVRQDWFERLKKDFTKEYKEVYQAILIPFANEGEHILERTILKIKESNYPREQIILALAPEARLTAGVELANKLRERHEKDFFKVYVFPHELKENEIVGKASNQNNGARELYKALAGAGVDTKNVILTSLDSDMQIHKQYLPLLTHSFLSEGEDRFKRIFQPIPMNLEGIWDTYAPAHLISSFGVQWFLSLVHRPFRFINFSVYATCLESVRKAGYWAPDIIPEDERFFWQMYFTFDGNVKVVPIFVPVIGESIAGGTFWKTVKAQYDQIRRWAWGVSEMRFVIAGAIKNKNIPWLKKSVLILNRMRSHVEWVIIPIVLTFGNFLPIWLSQDYAQSTLAYNVPTLTSRVLTITLFSFIFLVYIIQRFAPPKPEGWRKEKTLLHYVKWVIFPVVSIFLGSIPALDAQTRLLLGKSLVYKVAPKGKGQ